MDSRRPLIAFFTLFAVPALAEGACNYCNDRVTLSDSLAQCYLDGIDQHLQQVRRAGMQTAVFDLTACPDAPQYTGGDRSLGLPVPRVALEQDAEPVSLRFIIDLETAGCLAEQLRRESFDPERIKTFDLVAECEESR